MTGPERAPFTALEALDALDLAMTRAVALMAQVEGLPDDAPESYLNELAGRMHETMQGVFGHWIDLTVECNALPDIRESLIHRAAREAAACRAN